MKDVTIDMNNNGRMMLALATIVSLAVGLMLPIVAQQQALAQNNMTAGNNNNTNEGDMSVGSISGLDQDEVDGATGPTTERHPCPGQYVISWSPAICVPWPKGCPCEGPDCPKCPTPALPPTEPPAADVQLPPSDEEPLADEQSEQGQPDVQAPGDDESPEEEGSEGSNN
jgi:hypothetical protein